MINKGSISLLLLAAALAAVPPANAASDMFKFTFSDGNVSGSGILYGTLGDSGSWILTSGSGTFNDGTTSGPITLISNASGPGYSVVSPSGYFAYDDQLFPYFGPSQLMDEEGLLFSFNGAELNLWQGGNSPATGGWAESNGKGDLNGIFTLDSCNLQAPPGISISGTPVNVTPGATTANTSSITVTPAGSFAGNVSLSAAITSAPAGAQYPPTFSFGATNPVTLTSAAAGTATLTIATSAPTSSAQAIPGRYAPWYSTGGAVLGCILLIGSPTRRRKWQTVLGILVLLAVLQGGLLACGGGGSANISTGGQGTTTTGTTPGTYTITVTGTYGTFSTANTISLHVI